MLKQRREKQQQMELVIMEQMVPEDHFLRKVDRAVDFSFIYDLCAPLYCADNGRPAIDPEILFRMLLVGYLYGIKSEARLEAVLTEISGAGRVSVLYSDEGVAVVCEGAESARVRLDIVNAVSAYTGFGSDRIKVLSMERSD